MCHETAMTKTARALVYTAAGKAEIRDAPVDPADGDVLVRSLYSGISRGTERLVFSGRVPRTEWQTMRAPFQTADFPFPVKYGYAAVGSVEAGPDELVGRTVFCLHPHQTRFGVPAGAIVPVPDGVPARRAVLGANMETALNVVWDAGIAPAADVVIVGGGVLGLLVAALAAGMPGTVVTVVDVNPDRATIAEDLGARFALPDAVPAGADVVVHTSATGAGLATALGTAGDEATVVEASWFGDRAPAVPLGEAFHRRRLKLKSSQVGLVAPRQRPRWSHNRRLAAALQLLADPRLDALVTGEVAFDDLPTRLPAILGDGAPGLATAVRYD
jgi:threonine dehydrogenase-like Zn-dependent dehydrogenase